MTTQNIYQLTDVWNAGGTTFTGIGLSVTDTASAAGSLLMDLQEGASSKFSVRKDGRITSNSFFIANSGGFWSASDNGTITMGVSQDAWLRRDAANVIAMYNGVNAQAFRVYNTFTDASNYERARFSWLSNELIIGTEAAGSGSNRELVFRVPGTQMKFQTGGSSSQGWSITSGHFLALTDNTYDIGAAAANRPRSIYTGAGITCGGDVTLANAVIYGPGNTKGQLLCQSAGIFRFTGGSGGTFSRLTFQELDNTAPALKRNGTAINVRLADDSADAPLTAAAITAMAATAIPAGGTQGAGLKVSSTADFGVFFGSGAPTLSAAKGSLYLRSDGSTTNDRMYVNTDSATTWTAVTTAA
jgi:hypothetical protein